MATRHERPPLGYRSGGERLRVASERRAGAAAIGDRERRRAAASGGERRVATRASSREQGECDGEWQRREREP